MKTFFVVSIAYLLALGCSDDVEAEIDCNDICTRYSDCFDADLDISACTDSCEDKADRDPSVQDDIDDCENCIDGRSCTDGAVTCATECVAIL